MIKLGNNIYNSDEVISCVNFLKNSDVVFAGTLSENDFNDFQFENPKIISRSNGLVTFVNLAFDLNENKLNISSSKKNKVKANINYK